MLLILAFLATATAQNLGAYFSPCPAAAPVAVIQESLINSYLLGTDAQCLAAPPTDAGYTVCPAPSVFDAFFTDTDVYFRCAQSLSATCDGGCPANELCISTTVPSAPDDAFFLCGVPCAGGFYLCDDTGKHHPFLSPQQGHETLTDPRFAPHSNKVPQPVLPRILRPHRRPMRHLRVPLSSARRRNVRAERGRVRSSRSCERAETERRREEEESWRVFGGVAGGVGGDGVSGAYEAVRD
jgi:hypothetical protein